MIVTIRETVVAVSGSTVDTTTIFLDFFSITMNAAEMTYRRTP